MHFNTRYYTNLLLCSCCICTTYLVYETSPVSPPLQVVALQAHLQILSEEHQKQAEELALWRLTTNELTQVQMPWLSQDQTQEQAPCLGQEGQLLLGGSPSSVTVIREDELLLSCTSSRLYGRTLGSR